MPFECEKTRLPEVMLIKAKLFKDNRGYFAELYKASDFKKTGITKTFVQVNVSFSTKGVVRGLHYQLSPCGQGKLVSVISGEIFDVAVDIRQGSPGYGTWVGENLSAENGKLLYIPEGFAHGFMIVSDTARVMYQCTAEYSAAHERGVFWNDPALNIQWPVTKAILSDKDAVLPVLAKAEKN
jgi:dTDP-4-dehydrorhamnose 3,5-epimerase